MTKKAKKAKVASRGPLVIDAASGRRWRRGGKTKPKPPKVDYDPAQPRDIGRLRSVDAIADRLERRERIAANEAAAIEASAAPLRKVARQMRRGRNGPASLEMPTPHRAVKAGEVRADAFGAYHCDSVLRGLASRGSLDKNADRNRVLLEAGERYAAHWTQGYLIGLAAQDINREGRAGFMGVMAPAEKASAHAQQYRRASQELGPYFGAVVDAIVLNEEPVESVGFRISGYKSTKQAAAVAMDRLREGLSRLATLWRMAPLDASAPQSHIPRHPPDSRPADSPQPRALRTHRTLAGMR